MQPWDVSEVGHGIRMFAHEFGSMTDKMTCERRNPAGAVFVKRIWEKRDVTIATCVEFHCNKVQLGFVMSGTNILLTDLFTDAHIIVHGNVNCPHVDFVKCHVFVWRRCYTSEWRLSLVVGWILTTKLIAPFGVIMSVFSVVPVHTALQSRRRPSWYSAPWEPQVIITGFGARRCYPCGNFQCFRYEFLTAA
jgi:hypothetical protein